MFTWLMVRINDEALHIALTVSARSDLLTRRKVGHAGTV